MLAKVEVTDIKPLHKKRAKASATFEVMPLLLGFDKEVYLYGIDVDHVREMVTFIFSGDGLDEFGDCTTPEGQICVEILPPLWQAMIEFKKSEESS